MTDSRLEMDSFPCILENPSDFRKGSGDYGVTLAVQVKHVDQIQPLMAKAQKPFAAFLVPMGTIDQAEEFIKAQNGHGGLSGLPDPDAQSAIRDPQSAIATLEDVALALAVDPRTIQNYADAGLLVRNSRGQYDLLASLAAMNKARKDAETAESNDNRKEKGLILQAKRQRLQIDNLERAGELVNAASVRAAVEKGISENRTRWLFLPKYLAPKLEGLKVQEMEILLEDYVRASLTQLAAITISGRPGDAGIPDHGAPAKADRKPVGGRKKGAVRKKRR